MDCGNLLPAKRTSSCLDKESNDVGRTFCDLVGDKGESKKDVVDKESKRKFGLEGNHEKSGNNSEFEKMLNTCWAELDKCLDDEERQQRDSTQHVSFHLLTID